MASYSHSSSSSSSGPVRRATHAGSWYSENGRELSHQLDNWLSAVKVKHGPARAIIAPHAGYSYCGATAAFAYKQIDPTNIERVFILGPSHHICLSGCAVSPCSRYQTPLGDLIIDQKINSELLATNEFETMKLQADEDEHSIEMHLPYIYKVMKGKQFTIVPILVGSLSSSRQQEYGRILSHYIADPTNLFVVSSDFCHWGTRFHYSPYDRSNGDICDHINKLDKEGMRLIETLIPGQFTDYLKKTQNTICGRHPICLMLQAADQFNQMNNHWAEFKFLHYSQSNKCRHQTDSSVSYASGSLVINPK